MIQYCSIFGRFKGESIKSRITISRGRTTGFDYLRVTLSIMVILVHTPLTVDHGSHWIWDGPTRPFVAGILPAFFALSGFLVTGSLQRSRTLAEFAVLRALRLIPAQFVEVFMSALILGPILTQFSMKKYFTDPKLYVYFLNILGDIQYQLPGLFIHNPDANMVNRQLWTLPAELLCYATLGLLAALGFATRWRWMVVLLLVCLFFSPAIDVLRHRNLWAMDNVPKIALLLAFLSGVTLNLVMEWAPLNWSLFAICVVLSYLALAFRQSTYFACLPITYLTIFIGLLRPQRSFLTATGDYSYGIYLYGYPIQQTYAYLFPNFRIWWGSLLFTLPIALVLAYLSWTFVESKALGHRAKVVALANGLSAHLRRVLRWR